MRTKNFKLCAAAIAACAGGASAQISSTGPFTGPYTESFDTGAQTIFLPCMPDRVFNNFADMCTPGNSGCHTTSGWSFNCSIFPHSGPRLFGSAGGAVDITFDAAVSQFGGYFGTNAPAPDGTIEFFDAANASIGTDTILTGTCGTFAWHGWQSTVPVKRVRISGSYSGGGGGYLMMDDLEYSFGSQPTGACCQVNGNCIVSTQSGCAAIGGIYRGDTSPCATANCPQPPTGACCLPDLVTCTTTYLQNCTAQGGTYRGDNVACANANCPTPGACCKSDGTCIQTNAAGCTAAAGVYRGDSTACASANCPQPPFAINCNAQGTFTDISTTGTVLTPTGIDDGYAAFTSSVTNALVTNASLNVCTNGFITDAPYTNFNNLTLPVVGGGFALGLFPNWNDLWVDGTTGLLLHQGLIENGVPVEIIEWYQVQDYPGGGNPRGSFEVKIYGAGGPALVQFLYQSMAWDTNGANSTVGFQWGPSSGIASSFNVPNSIADNGVCSIVANATSAPCYANCDHGTTLPCLNVNDFTCFLNQFSSGTTYANCDNSTTPPVLNVNDFTCFLNRFSSGCSSC